MTQKQLQFDKKTRDDQAQIGWASQPQKLSDDKSQLQSMVQKLSPQQLKHLKEHHHDVVERFQNATGQTIAPLPKQPAVDPWPVVAAKPFEQSPSASLWSGSASQLAAAPAALGKDSILSSFGQRKPPTANAPSLQSFLNGQQNCGIAFHPPPLCFLRPVCTGTAPGVPAVHRGFDTLVRAHDASATNTLKQQYSTQRAALASAPSSDAAASIFGINSNRVSESRGSIGSGSFNPRYMTSYNHMSILSVGRAAPQMR